MASPPQVGGADEGDLGPSSLERALDAAFAPAPPPAADGGAAPSVLQWLQALAGELPAVSLRGPAPAGAPPVPAFPDDAGAAGANGHRYAIGAELGRGGVGVVHRAHDRDLRRDVAIKVLRTSLAHRPEVVRRFVEEAQIGGQLQHPGIVPVYELGIARGTPFIAMKLVQGRTLARLLAERPSPATDRSTFLAVFERVCQTVAYAHACGVVHRDLKPANVMIGSFGEVQVVDWGMGKVLPPPGGDARDGRPPEATRAIATSRSSDAGDRSSVGTVMGTPAYMPPEQARGDVDAMDERSDVFALGAILCELLTGQPPYVHRDEKEVLAMAACARLDDARARLAACGAEPALLDLARRCLRAAPGERPRSADVVAGEIHAHLAAAEARVHEARLAAAEAQGRAASLARIQRLGLALTIAIAVGLAASLWFWRTAEQQRGVADANLASFHRLSNVVRLDRARATEQTLFPAWPDKVAAMRVWLEGDAAGLRRALPELRATLARLDARTLPQTEAERDEARRNHPRSAELENMQRKLAWLRRVHAIRTKTAPYEPHRFNDAKLPTTARRLNELAWPVVHPERVAFGREAAGLELARRAVALPPEAGDDRAQLLGTLAWALFANGLDAEARARSQEALAAASDGERARYRWYVEQLEEKIAAASNPTAQLEIDRLAEEVAALEASVEEGREHRFADDGERFLYTTLTALAADIEAFLQHDVPAVAQRLFWAERVEELTVTRYRERWAQARRAILRADGVTASELYAEAPLDLRPQQGLVPIGMNPRSKLWEFYHPRSAWDPMSQTDPAEIEIPAYDADGELEVADGGLVFVLIPGGASFMGAQAGDENAPNHDPWAEADEVPVREMELAPFFFSKYELTQGQWARLGDGQRPSWHRSDKNYPGMPVPVGETHPVEQVGRNDCEQLLARFGLVLPTEAQWERGARAGTSAPWSTGAEPASLEGYANLLDQTGMNAGPKWRGGEAFDDGFKVPSPVGTFAPNAFGLHDVHGNVGEWARDPYSVEGYHVWPRPGDGLRAVLFEAESSHMEVSRGGSVASAARFVRSAERYGHARGHRSAFIGVRPARIVSP